MWKVITRNHHYSINEQGQVRNDRTGRIQKHQLSNDGYYTVSLGYGKTAKIHRLLAEAFLPEPQDGQTEVAHNDGCRTNIDLSNLRWASRRENQLDRLAHGTDCRGEKNYYAAFSNDEVHKIRQRLLAEKISNVALAKEFGVSHETIRNIRLNRSYV